MRRLREVGCQVVVATCPDVGSVRPIPQPLRWVARRLSRQLAAAQMIACVRQGAHVVSLADELGEEFSADPDLFAEDRFHPGRRVASVSPRSCSPQSSLHWTPRSPVMGPPLR